MTKLHLQSFGFDEGFDLPKLELFDNLTSPEMEAFLEDFENDLI